MLSKSYLYTNFQLYGFFFQFLVNVWCSSFLCCQNYICYYHIYIYIFVYKFPVLILLISCHYVILLKTSFVCDLACFLVMFRSYFHLIPQCIFGFAVSFAISVYGVWRARAGVQVYKRELLHTYALKLGQTRISSMYQKKKITFDS